MIGTIEELLARPVSFLDNTNAVSGDGIAISSRVRLARNLAHHRFPCSADDAEKQEICQTVSEAVRDGKILDFDGECREFDLSTLDETERGVLLERRLASSEFVSGDTAGKMLMVCPQERCSIMINEEDQIRMQSIRPGFQLPEVYAEISAIDDALSQKVDYAFDEQLGYLTSCPTNVGTGMRASVMLHLPGLVLTNQIAPTIHGINKLHLAARGIFGEGSENLGNLFQISNQSTLGESEEKTINDLASVIEQIIYHEKRARQTLLDNDRYSLLDYIGRAYGVLRHSYKLTGAEALKSLSGVRLGVELGLFNAIDLAKVNELFIASGQAHLQKNAGHQLNSNARDILRAQLCREKLKG